MRTFLLWLAMLAAGLLLGWTLPVAILIGGVGTVLAIMYLSLGLCWLMGKPVPGYMLLWPMVSLTLGLAIAFGFHHLLHISIRYVQ
jgi:hypothetical protein